MSSSSVQWEQETVKGVDVVPVDGPIEHVPFLGDELMMKFNDELETTADGKE